MEAGGFSRQNVEPHQKRRFCFIFRRNSCKYRPAVGLSWWQKIGQPQAEIRGGSSLWARGLDALKRIRDWSEILAGPRWKTFIRSFDRPDRNGSKYVDFRYDPLSYAMNFDEGPGQNSHLDDDGEDGYFSRNFSSRYAKGYILDLGSKVDVTSIV
ncbi:hypothetical protein F511_16154 [Dorcoceras hygrometricum]|uniref:Uncharacterized protein n=1 Tax=Dorcoceras hygrometricum TaxID=472368 RepID=A0A2Z7DG11_9LAMI|nr:hypothetical protein F511_16154 [Dorcoceras hygrometricum]